MRQGGDAASLICYMDLTQSHRRNDRRMPLPGQGSLCKQTERTVRTDPVLPGIAACAFASAYT